MTSRFLTVAAVAGMLLATGCGGGGSQSGSGLTPSTPSTGGSTSTGSGSSSSSSSTATNGASFSVSFQVPAAALTTPSSASRSAQYISPGSSGLQILLSAAGAGTFAVGTQTTPIQLAPTPPAGITANLNTGAYGVNTTSTPFLSGTAQLSGNIANTVVAGQSISFNTIPGSSTITPVVGQTFTVKNTDAPAAGVLTATLTGTVNGTPGTGLILTATVTNVVGGTNNNGFTTGNLITWNAGSTTQSTYTYTFVPQTNVAGSGAPGYYTATITFNNMTGGQNYVIGVVLTDITQTGNPVLSEAQTGATMVAASGPTAFPALSLRPVVAGVYIPAPTVPSAAQDAADGAPVNSFESTVFLTDAKGYVIINQNAAPAIDNAASVAITASGATLGNYGVYSSLPSSNLSITAPPTTMTFAAGFPALTVLGTLLTNYSLPILPATLTLVNGVITNANGVGTPISIACSAPGTATITAKLTTTVPTTVGGYTYTPGTNVPVAAQTTLSNPATSIPSINCNPSIVLPLT